MVLGLSGSTPETRRELVDRAIQDMDEQIRVATLVLAESTREMHAFATRHGYRPATYVRAMAKSGASLRYEKHESKWAYR